MRSSTPAKKKARVASRKRNSGHSAALAQGIDRKSYLLVPTLSPEPVDIVHEYFVLRALDHAFQRIGRCSNTPAEKNGHRIRYRQGATTYEEEGLELIGITKLHDAKVAYTVYQMLEESGLVYGRTDDGFSLVNELAAYLIISFLAQRMSVRLPMRTIHAAELKARIESLTKQLGRDIARIKRSRIGESVRRLLPIGIGAVVTLGSAFVPDTPSLKYVTGAAAVAVQILTEALHKTPVPSRLEGAQSLLLKASEDILDAQEIASALDMSVEHHRPG